VRGIENQLKRFRHPKIGTMSLHQTNWWSAPKNGDRLLVYVPADEQSRMALNTLAAQAKVEQPNAPHRPKKTAQ